MAVAALLASLLGLVATGGRESSRPPRAIAPAEPWRAQRTSVELSAPAAPPADDPVLTVAPAVAGVATNRPADTRRARALTGLAKSPGRARLSRARRSPAARA
jgi:hypothetical protein